MTVHSVRNLTKAKVLYFLYQHPGQHFTVSQLADATGVPLGSLFVLVSRWRSWDPPLVHWFEVSDEHGQHFEYSLSGHGRAYLKSMPKWYAHWKEAIGQVKARERQPA